MISGDRAGTSDIASEIALDGSFGVVVGTGLSGSPGGRFRHRAFAGQRGERFLELLQLIGGGLGKIDEDGDFTANLTPRCLFVVEPLAADSNSHPFGIANSLPKSLDHVLSAI